MFSLPVRVYYEDTDAGGVVYHASYLRYMERARTDWLRELGFAHQRLASEFGMHFVVQAMQIRFLRPAKLDDLLTATASIESLGHARVVFGQTVERGSETLARASVSAACLELATGKPVPMPGTLRNNLKEKLKESV
jgi:acyl-CoA thioester hydrolase